MFWNWFGLARDRDAGRFVFAYRDGTRKRRADPVAVEVMLEEQLGSDWKGVIRSLDRPPILAGLVGTQAEDDAKERAKTRKKVLRAIDIAFGVHAYTDHEGTQRPSGLTELERFGLLEAFFLFCADLVRLARPFVSAPPRDSPSPASPPPASGPDST